MEYFLARGESLPEAYHQALFTLEEHGSVIDCSDYNQKQKECAMTIHITKPLKEDRISKLFIGGPHELQQYEMEMLDGILDFEIQPEKGKWSYTYHGRYAPYYDFVIAELKRNKESRRAVIAIRDNDEDLKWGDPSCWQSCQFMIRNEKLDMFNLFRSNDLPEAFFMNAFALIRLQERAAQELGIEVGTYTHTANSMHCYEKDFSLLDHYCRRLRTDTDLTYNYANDWKELMEDEIPVIKEFVNDLHKKYEESTGQGC
jgi:thymidylate synthase